MINTATPATNDPVGPEDNTDDIDFYELKFSPDDLIAIACALNDTLTRAYDQSAANLTDLGIRQNIKLLRRLNMVVFGRANPPKPWTQYQRQHWRLALIAERKALHIAGRLPTLEQAPL